MRAFLLLVISTAACHAQLPVAGGLVKFVARGPGSRVEVLDWGGNGPALFFLPGLGNTAHVYEDFASRFADRYRVVAMTPRPFGASTPNDRGAPLDTLLADIGAVIDTLRLGRVVLVGNSLGGDLATFFASRYPARVSSVIYIDGANDRRPGHQPSPRGSWPSPPAQTAQDSSSDRAYQRYVARTFGPRLPLTEVHATLRFDAQGRVAGSVTPGAVTGVLLRSLTPPPYADVRVPTLALYPSPDRDRYDMPYWNQLKGPARASADSLQAWLMEANRSNIDSIRAMLPRVEVREIPRSGHLMFLFTPDEVEAAMRRFLERHTGR